MKNFRCLFVLTICISTISVVMSKAQSSVVAEDQKQAVVLTGTLPMPSCSMPERSRGVSSSNSATAKQKGNAVQAAPVINKLLLGKSGYDLQSNGSIYRRILDHVEGGVHFPQVIWLASPDTGIATQWATPPFPNRGSHYAVIDLTDPSVPLLAIPDGGTDWSRLEDIRTGFPSLVELSSKGEIGIMAHSGGADGVVFSSNTGFASPTVTTTPCTPTAADALWAHTAVDGKGYVHSIHTYNTGHSKDGTLGYIRSIDGGKTWDDEIAIATPASFGVSSADSYSIVADKNSVYIIYHAINIYLRVLKSTDNGATFTGVGSANGILFGKEQRALETVNYTDNGNGTVSYRSKDSTITPGGSSSGVIDADGKLNLAFTQYPSYYGGIGRIVKSSTGADSLAPTSPARDTIFSTSTDHSDYRSLGLAFWKEGEANAIEIAPPCGGTWDGNGSVISFRSYSESLSSRPSLSIDPTTGNLYCIYSSFANGDTKAVQWDSRASVTSQNSGIADTSLTGLQMHTYLTAKTPSGSWTTPVRLTGLGKDHRDATAIEKVSGGMLMIAWQEDDFPGCYLSNSQIIQPVRQASVFYGNIPVNSISGVDDENGVVTEGGISVSCYPNPVVDVVSVKVFNQEGLNTSVRIVDFFGRTLATLGEALAQSDQNFSFDTRVLPNGVYHIVATNGVDRASKKFQVIR